MNLKPLLQIPAVLGLGIVIGYQIPKTPTDTEDAVIAVKETDNSLTSANNQSTMSLSAIPAIRDTTGENPFGAVINNNSSPDKLTRLGSTLSENASGPTNEKRVTVDTVLNDLKLTANWQHFNRTGIEELANSEIQFLRHINNHPDLITPLLVSYNEMKQGAAKDFLRAMLSASGDLNVERFALEKLTQQTQDKQEQWLSLLAGIGVNSEKSRDALFATMQTLTKPHSLVLALNAFFPEVLPKDKQRHLTERFSYYAEHPQADVRSAGIQAMSRWADKEDTQFIENALNDKSDVVRTTAANAAFVHSFKSETIKKQLVSLLADEDQPYHLRIIAHDALSAYSLDENEYRHYLEFSIDRKQLSESSGIAKG